MSRPLHEAKAMRARWPPGFRVGITKGNQRGRLTCSGGLLFGQCLLKRLLSVSDEIFVACRVDENTGSILRIVL